MYSFRYALRNSTCAWRYRYSTVSIAKHEVVTVQRGSNGHVVLEILHPPVARAGGNPVLLYLPRGPLLESENPDDKLASLLCTSSNSTVVKVNYRLSRQHQYPSPVHDVLAAFDWVAKHLARRHLKANDPPKATNTPIGVCGELVGGSLATMLALTECRRGSARIIAAATNNAITDWIFTSQESSLSAKEGKSRSKKVARQTDPWHLYATRGPITPRMLQLVRSACFARPAHYFDPFASPVLFLRTPGVDTPSLDTSLNDDFAALLGLWEDENVKPQAQFEAIKRKMPRTWPPSGIPLEIPHMRVAVGDHSLLAGQGAEIVKRLRMAFVKLHTGQLSDKFLEDVESAAEGESGVGEQSVRAATAEAEKRISLHTARNDGLWCARDSNSWMDEINATGRWFNSVLK